MGRLAFAAGDARTALLDRMPALVLAADASGMVSYANALAQRQLSSAEESPIGLPLAELAPEIVGASWPAFIATLRATGRLTVETRLRTVDGRVIPAEATAELMTFPGGTELCALFARDLRAEEGRKRQERFVQFSFEHLPDAAYCIRFDGSFAYVNQAACDLLGYSREELESMQIFDINPALDRERWDQLFEALLRDKRRRFASAHLTKDGRMVSVEVSSNLLEIDGESFACSFARDISERKAQDEGRQREHTFVESLIDTAPVIVLVLDDAGRIVRFNGCTERATGYALDELRGQRWLDTLVAEEDRVRVAGLLRESMSGASMRGSIYRVCTKQGTPRDVVWYDQLLVDPASGQVTLLAIGQDVTEQRELEQRLRQAEKMEAIGRLAGGIAHDFNNQLTAIMGWTDVLSQEVDGSPELVDCTDRIMVAVRRACDLTSQLLAYSRKGKAVTKPVDLHELVHEVAAILRRSLDKRIDIRLDLAAEAPRTVGDPTQLGNALLNLALNARDAMPDGGILRFGTRLIEVCDADHASGGGAGEIEAGTFVELSVVDNGIGMDDETQRHMFEPFFTTKDEGRGTGMGLAAVYGTVKSHRGTIGITSALGRGTTVRICLPLTRATADEVKPPKAITALPVAAPRVMLVDDEDLVRDIVTRLLRHLGCQVTSFSTGFEAVEHYRANPSSIDVIVLDMVMPLLDGRSTYYALKAIEPRARVILVSGYSIDGAGQALVDEGAAAFLQKPFRLATLADALVSAASTRISAA